MNRCWPRLCVWMHCTRVHASMWALTTLSQHLQQLVVAELVRAEKAQKIQFLHGSKLAGCVVWCLLDPPPPHTHIHRHRRTPLPPVPPPPPASSPFSCVCKLPLLPLVNYSQRMPIIPSSCWLKTKPPVDKTVCECDSHHSMTDVSMCLRPSLLTPGQKSSQVIEK